MRASPLAMALVLLLNAPVLHAQHRVQQEWDSILNLAYRQQDSLAALYKTLAATLDTATGAAVKKDLQYKLYSLNKTIALDSERALQSALDLVERNLSSPVSLDILYFGLNRLELYKEGVKYYDRFDAVYKHLNKALRNSKKGKEMQAAFLHFKNSGVGKQAPGFTVKDVDHKQLSLSAFLDRQFVLIDFWASWCVPCRQDFPFLKRIYEQYHPKGFEIIAVSTDQDPELWRNAIRNDSIDGWRHVAATGNNGSVLSSYFVEGVPVKVLLNKHGTIIGRWVGGGEQHQKELESLLRNIFK
jgi:thiol-disulfide isomerase/thioredoxin